MTGLIITIVAIVGFGIGLLVGTLEVKQLKTEVDWLKRDIAGREKHYTELAKSSARAADNYSEGIKRLEKQNKALEDLLGRQSAKLLKVHRDLFDVKPQTENDHGEG